jgi:hypothetical protein
MTVVRLPRENVKDLVSQAERASNFNGHPLGRWHTYESCPWVRQTWCQRCGAVARVESKSINDQRLGDHIDAKGVAAVLNSPAADFLTNEPRAWGDALTHKCPSPHPPVTPERARELDAEEDD